jgi:serine/threonine protein kinase
MLLLQASLTWLLQWLALSGKVHICMFSSTSSTCMINHRFNCLCCQRCTAWLEHEHCFAANVLTTSLTSHASVLVSESIEISHNGCWHRHEVVLCIEFKHAEKLQILTSYNDVLYNNICIHRYMSPERLAGEGYGAPGDIWSLGILLLEMATRFVQHSIILLLHTCMLCAHARLDICC